MRKFSLFAPLTLAACVAAPVGLAAGGYGLTWSKLSHETSYSTDKVTCAGCNAYTGDTACTTVLPVLCIKNDSSPNPGLVIDYYNGWAGGHIYQTPAVAGTTLTSLSAADALCASSFGSGYRMAEFHDGAGGWGWSAYGNIAGTSRFWVYINDQNANCWNP